MSLSHSIFQTPGEAPVQYLDEPLFRPYGVQLAVKREDMLHPRVSGNKWRKLKYNLLEARAQGHHTLLSFGGAYSNHIHALAAVGKELNFTTIGIIRGEYSAQENPTLRDARRWGMQLHFIDRERYRLKAEPAFLQALQEQYGPAYVLPEGGSNPLALKGVAELWHEVDGPFDYVATAAGTGATAAGVICGAPAGTEVRVFAVLKGADFLQAEIGAYIKEVREGAAWQLHTQYHQGGYARLTPQLVAFMDRFQARHGIPLDPIYTAKMMYGLYQQVLSGGIVPHSRVLALHTGGLQGTRGMQPRLQALRGSADPVRD